MIRRSLGLALLRGAARASDALDDAFFAIKDLEFDCRKVLPTFVTANCADDLHCFFVQTDRRATEAAFRCDGLARGFTHQPRALALVHRSHLAEWAMARGFRVRFGMRASCSHELRGVHSLEAALDQCNTFSCEALEAEFAAGATFRRCRPGDESVLLEAPAAITFEPTLRRPFNRDGAPGVLQPCGSAGPISDSSSKILRGKCH